MMMAANEGAGTRSRRAQAGLSTLDAVVTLRVEGDKGALESGKAEPEMWESMLFWVDALGPGWLAQMVQTVQMAQMAKSGLVGAGWERRTFAGKARGRVRGCW